MSEEAVAADLEQDNRTKATGFAAAFSRNTLLENATAQIGIIAASLYVTRSPHKSRIRQLRLAGKASKLLGHIDSHVGQFLGGKDI